MLLRLRWYYCQLNFENYNILYPIASLPFYYISITYMAKRAPSEFSI